MHAEAWEFLSGVLLPYRDQKVRVLELGSRNINGSTRNLFTRAEYVGLDIAPGDGVDIVADAADWVPDVWVDDREDSYPSLRPYDVVISSETFEHTPRWPEICLTAYKALADCGGIFVVTAATEPRGEHSAVDGFGLRENEYYGNVNPKHLESVLCSTGFKEVQVTVHPRGDVYATALSAVVTIA